MGTVSTVRSCLTVQTLSAGTVSELFSCLFTSFINKNSPIIIITMTRVRQNFAGDSEALINKQINMGLYASYVYLSMSAYFARDDIALHGFSKRFRAASSEEKEHAEKLIDYQTMRGGRVTFREIAKPSSDDWGTALEAVLAVLSSKRPSL